MVCWEFKLCCEVLLLLNVADMECFLCETCGVSSAEYRVHLVSVSRAFFVHSWQNGTRCRDGVDVLWCCSNLVQLGL